MTEHTSQTTPVMTMSNPSHKICTMSCGLQDMEKFNNILLYTKNLENNCFILKYLMKNETRVTFATENNFCLDRLIVIITFHLMFD